MSMKSEALPQAELESALEGLWTPSLMPPEKRDREYRRLARKNWRTEPARGEGGLELRLGPGPYFRITPRLGASAGLDSEGR